MISFSSNNSDDRVLASYSGSSFPSLTFWTNSTERMRIDNSGNVGIGTTNPAAILDIVRTAGAGGSSNNYGVRSNFTVNIGGSGSGRLYGIYTEPVMLSGGGGDNIVYGVYSSPSATGNTTVYSGIFMGGNVGIGTQTPSVKLDIASSGTTSTIMRVKNDTTSVYLDANNGYAYLNTFSDHPLLFGTNNSERMRIAANGNVGMGQTSPAAKLHVQGAIVATDNITAYFSDERLKTITGTIPDALEKVNSLEGIYFKENDKAKELGFTDDKLQIGVRAQSVEKVLPEAVTLAPFDIKLNESGEQVSKSGENYLTVRYEKIVPLLIEAIKELSKIVQEQNKTISELKNTK